MGSCSQWLRIAVVQFAPKIGEVHANIAKARELCRGLTPRSVDLVCFPEMIFSGYMFPDAPSIAPYLEHPKTGPTSTFCAELARHLQCYVAAGFPERLDLAGDPCRSLSTAPALSSPTSSSCAAPDSPPSLIGANAAYIYDHTGHLLHAYHKSNLFCTDRTWARPGPGFTAFDLPPFGRTAVAICNDLNVSEGVWHSIEEGPYELAGWCRREGVKVLVLLNAWLKSEEEKEEGGREGEGEDNADSAGTDPEDDGLEPNWQVLNYWAMRLRPLWAKDGDSERSETCADMAGDDRLLVVVCNRFGHERGKTFAGSSAMFAMRPGSGKPHLLHAMGEREEGVRVWTARIGSDSTYSTPVSS